MKRFLYSKRQSRFLNEGVLNLNLNAVAHMPVGGDEYQEDVADTYLQVLEELKAAEKGERLFILLEHTLPYLGYSSDAANEVITLLRDLSQSSYVYSNLNSALRLDVQLPIEHYLKDVAYEAIQSFNEDFSSRFDDEKLIEYLIDEGAWLNSSHIPELIEIE